MKKMLKKVIVGVLVLSMSVSNLAYAKADEMRATKNDTIGNETISPTKENNDKIAVTPPGGNDGKGGNEGEGKGGKEDMADVGKTAATPEKTGDKENGVNSDGEVEARRTLTEALQDVDITFMDKLISMSVEDDLYSSLKAVPGDVLQSFLAGMSMEEHYQYAIFIQYEYLMGIVKDGALEKKKREELDFFLHILKENSDLLLQGDVATLTDPVKVKLERTLFDSVFAQRYKDAKYVPESGGEETDVTDFAGLRCYLAEKAPNSVDIEEVYGMLGCYREESIEENIEKRQKDCAASLAALYETNPKDPQKDDVEQGVVTGQGDKKPENDKAQEAQPDGAAKDEEETKPENKPETKPEPILPEVTAEVGEGVLEGAACRTIDTPPDPKAIIDGLHTFRMAEDVPEEKPEEKYYEVYAKASLDKVENMRVDVSVQSKKDTDTYEAEKGNYEIGGTEYNWRLRLPYSELPLEGTDGTITANLTALDGNGKAIGKMNVARRANGVYSNIREWVGPDFAKLNTNKNADQVYYVYGTVYSDDYNHHLIHKNSVYGPKEYSHLSVSSYYEDEKATVIVRPSSYKNKGTWVAVYGRTELNNLNIISTGNSGDLGIVSAKNPDPVTPSTWQSVMTVRDCDFSNAEKWAIHGDRNSFLDVSYCNINNTKGGIGGHGEMSVRNCTLDNRGSKYTRSAGIHLNVPVTQGGIPHSVDLENNWIEGYPIGVEYAASNFFSDQPVGGRINSFDMASTGYGNNISDCQTGITITKNGVNIPMNIDLQGTIKELYGCNTGIRTANGNDTIKMSDGNIHDNTDGIMNKGTYEIYGGDIYGNINGINNPGNTDIRGGTVRQNSIGVNNVGTMTVSGGNIYGNTSKGVYQNGSFWFSGGQVSGNSGCDVYLETGHVIDWAGQDNTVTLINSRSKALGTELVRNQSAVKLGQKAEDYFDVVYGGRYTDRGGDRNGCARGSLVVSEYYTVTYLSNSSYGEISNMPANGVKYWNESYMVPGQKPINKTYGYILFNGWDYNGDGTADANMSSILTMNKDIAMNALWKDRIKVIYHPNGGMGEEKREIVTNGGIMEAGGSYPIRNNAGFTNFAREGYTYVGFDFASGQNPKQTAYKEGRDNRISFQNLLSYSYEKQGELRADLYAIWNKQPEIKFSGVNEFYEGTDVGCADLKNNVTVWDKEDGDITGSLKIMEIKYAEGKLVDGVPTAGQTVKFGEGMSNSDRLDTWFMALDKKKSPVTHAVVYEVTDSMGGVTRAEHEVRVKYNEFPEIVARDRYFTIEEAQSGIITEDLLIKDALESGKVKVKDVEEDAHDPEYIKSRLKLTHFVPEEFTSLKYGGMIELEYTVKDSMGPGGGGKETRQKVKIHIVKQGEVPPAPVTSKVRFIDEENYRKNEGKAELNLSKEEKEELNQNGGLHVDSIWYTNQKNKALIERCFDETAEPLKVYNFTDAEVREAKKYIENYGIGNSQDETALSRFRDKFMR